MEIPDASTATVTGKFSSYATWPACPPPKSRFDDLTERSLKKGSYQDQKSRQTVRMRTIYVLFSIRPAIQAEYAGKPLLYLTG